MFDVNNRQDFAISTSKSSASTSTSGLQAAKAQLETAVSVLSPVRTQKRIDAAWKKRCFLSSASYILIQHAAKPPAKCLSLDAKK